MAMWQHTFGVYVWCSPTYISTQNAVFQNRLLSPYIYLFSLNLSLHRLESKTFWNLALLLYSGAGMNLTGRPLE